MKRPSAAPSPPRAAAPWKAWSRDDLYGTVVTIDHGDGTKAVYANLASEPAVAVNDAVEPGYIIGAVGTSALAEVGQQPHLHFAVTANGQSK